MICAVSLWKSSHACSDGANVRDSTVANRFNAYFFCDCFSHCFTMRFLRGINRLRCLRGIDRWAAFAARPLVEAPPANALAVIVWIESHTALLCRISSAPA